MYFTQKEQVCIHFNVSHITQPNPTKETVATITQMTAIQTAPGAFASKPQEELKLIDRPDKFNRK
ncbi:hypothetical protein [Ancylomarina sp.]|uniref:hypothetical protein n=1 Tax=Ancylomarina sp. TaxID=1970196 RepID=UPI003562906F